MLTKEQDMKLFNIEQDIRDLEEEVIICPTIDLVKRYKLSEKLLEIADKLLAKEQNDS